MANSLDSLQVVYDRFRQNDPNYKEFDTWCHYCIRFTNYQAVQLGLALEGNTVVEKIFIDIDEVSVEGTGELAHYVATSSTLEQFHMRGYISARSRRIQLMAVVDRFLSAIAYNGNLRSIGIPDVFSSVPLAVALRSNCNSLTDLNLCFRYLPAEPFTQSLINEAEVATGTVGTLHKLKAIKINSWKECYFTASTIHNLMSHPTLQKLVLSLNFIEMNVPMCAYVLQDLFRSTTPLEDVYIECEPNYENEFVEVVPIIFSGLYGHKTIRNLTLDFQTKNDENAMAICDLLRNNPGITDLTVRVDTLHGFALIAECLDKNKKLHDLVVIITNANNDDSFHVEACKKLEKSLASMKNLTRLSFQVETASKDTPFPPEIIHGLEGNECLTSISFEWDDQDIDKVRELATYYIERNVWCPKLIDAATKGGLVDLFIEMKNGGYEEEFVSLVFEALRRKDGFW